MTFALTSAKFFGEEHDEALTNNFVQYARFKITAANTNVAFDFGNFSGTLWSALDDTANGLLALNAMKDLVTKMDSFVYLLGKGIAQYAQADASQTNTVVINSAASSGGAATETYTVTGLLTTDTIQAVTQFVDGAGAAVGILSYGGATGNAAADNALAVVYNADPGANAKIKVVVSRAGITTVQAGTFQQTLNATTGLPELLYVTGDAPTAYDIELKVELKAGTNPINVEFV